jgi:hypothetical protein
MRSEQSEQRSIQAQVLALLDPQIGQTACQIYLKTSDLTPNQVHHALYRLRGLSHAGSQRRGHGLDLLWTKVSAKSVDT